MAASTLPPPGAETLPFQTLGGRRISGFTNKTEPRACPRDPEANSFPLFPVPGSASPRRGRHRAYWFGVSLRCRRRHHHDSVFARIYTRQCGRDVSGSEL